MPISGSTIEEGPFPLRPPDGNGQESAQKLLRPGKGSDSPRRDPAAQQCRAPSAPLRPIEPLRLAAASSAAPALPAPSAARPAPTHHCLSPAARPAVPAHPPGSRQRDAAAGPGRAGPAAAAAAARWRGAAPRPAPRAAAATAGSAALGSPCRWHPQAPRRRRPAPRRGSCFCPGRAQQGRRAPATARRRPAGSACSWEHRPRGPAAAFGPPAARPRTAPARRPRHAPPPSSAYRRRPGPPRETRQGTPHVRGRAPGAGPRAPTGRPLQR